jgi:hypothetical protein
VVVSGDVAVNFIGADLVVTQVVFAGHLEQGVCADQVGLAENERIEDAAVHVRFGCKIDDRRDLTTADHMADQFEVPDVTDDNLEVVCFVCVRLELPGQVFPAGGVGHFVEHGDARARTGLEEMMDEVAADEAATASDQDVSEVCHDVPVGAS